MKITILSHEISSYVEAGCWDDSTEEAKFWGFLIDEIRGDVFLFFA